MKKDSYKIRCKVVRIFDEDNDNITKAAERRLSRSKGMKKVFKANKNEAYIRGTFFHHHFKHLTTFAYDDIETVEKSLRVPGMLIIKKKDNTDHKYGIVFEDDKNCNRFLKLLSKNRPDLNITDLQSRQRRNSEESDAQNTSATKDDSPPLFGSDDMANYETSNSPNDFYNGASPQLQGILSKKNTKKSSIDELIDDIVPVGYDTNYADNEEMRSQSDIPRKKEDSMYSRFDTPEATFDASQSDEEKYETNLLQASKSFETPVSVSEPSKRAATNSNYTQMDTPKYERVIIVKKKQNQNTASSFVSDNNSDTNSNNNFYVSRSNFESQNILSNAPKIVYNKPSYQFNNQNKAPKDLDIPVRILQSIDPRLLGNSETNEFSFPNNSKLESSLNPKNVQKADTLVFNSDDKKFSIEESGYVYLFAKS